jgi:glucokinase
MTLTIGVDVGGTKIAAGVVDEDGTILAEDRVESPAESVEAIEQAIADLVASLAEGREIAAVGVGAAGFVDATRSRVLTAPNLAWKDLDLRAHLEARTGLPVVIENDANAAAWGEFRFGAAREDDDLLLVTVGTGVGGGVVIDGELFRGAHGVGAEIGHIRVVRDGELCGCGLHGCLEAYASGSALTREAREAAAADPARAAAVIELAGGDPQRIEGRMVSEAAANNDPFARDRLTRLGTWLGEGIASLAAVLDPGVVAIGGGVAEVGDLLLDPLRTSFARNITGGRERPHPEFRVAKLGNKAGLVGAADLARR